MIDDPIVDEVRRAGEAYFAKFGFNLQAICEDLNRQGEEKGRRVVSFPPRKPEQPARDTGAAVPTAAGAKPAK